MIVKILVDGNKLKLNDFVELIFGNTINGAVSSLSGVNKDWKKLEIRVER